MPKKITNVSKRIIKIYVSPTNRLILVPKVSQILTDAEWKAIKNNKIIKNMIKGRERTSFQPQLSSEGVATAKKIEVKEDPYLKIENVVTKEDEAKAKEKAKKEAKEKEQEEVKAKAIADEKKAKEDAKKKEENK